MTVFHQLDENRYRIELQDMNPFGSPVDQREMTVAEMLAFSDSSATSVVSMADAIFAAKAGLFEEDLVLTVHNAGRLITIVP